MAHSPETVARLEAESEANAAIEAGDLQSALAAVESGLTKIPNDPSLLLMQGVLWDILGDKEKATANFAQAQSSMANPIDFHLARSQLELRLSRPEQAEEDARAALELDTKSAAAWLLLGQALEGQNRGFEAINAYQQAGQLALESGDSQIVVIARLALARLEAGGGMPQ